MQIINIYSPQNSYPINSIILLTLLLQKPLCRFISYFVAEMPLNTASD